MRKKLGFVNYISIDGAPPVLMDSLTEEQKAYCAETMAQKLSKTMSDYFSLHPEEYEEFVKGNG